MANPAALMPPLLAARRFIDHPLVIGLIFLGGLAVFIYLAYQLNKFVEARRVRGEHKRGDAIASALSGHGLVLTYYKSGQHAALLQQFEYGQRGEAGTRMVWNLMESPAGAVPMLRMMDYGYVAWNGQRRVVRGATVALVEHTGLALPHFHLTKEEQWEWVQKLTKTQDIDFAEHPAFSKMYHLRGGDEAAIRALFTPQIREALERHPGLTIEGHGSQLLIFREGDVPEPKQRPGFLDEVRQVAQLFVRQT